MCPSLELKDTRDSPIRVRYRNPVAALLSFCASLTYWLVYWLAHIIIYLAGLAIICGLLVPRHAWHWLNHLLDQYHIERQFKDEL